MRRIGGGVAVIMLVIFIIFVFFVCGFLCVTVGLNSVRHLLDVLFRSNFLLGTFACSRPFAIRKVFGRIFTRSCQASYGGVFVTPLVTIPLLNSMLSFAGYAFDTRMAGSLFSNIRFNVKDGVCTRFCDIDKFLSLCIFDLMFLFFVVLLTLSACGVGSSLFCYIVFIYFTCLYFCSGEGSLVKAFLDLGEIIFINVLVSFLTVLSGGILAEGWI